MESYEKGLIKFRGQIIRWHFTPIDWYGRTWGGGLNPHPSFNPCSSCCWQPSFDHSSVSRFIRSSSSFNFLPITSWIGGSLCTWNSATTNDIWQVDSTSHTWSLESCKRHGLSSTIGNTKFKQVTAAPCQHRFTRRLHETGNCTYPEIGMLHWLHCRFGRTFCRRDYSLLQFLEVVFGNVLPLSIVKNTKSSSRLPLLMLISSTKLFGVIDTKFKYVSQKIYMYKN